MKSKLFICIAGIAACGTGCGPLELTARTVIIEPSEYCLSYSGFKERVRDHRLAEEAWNRITCAFPKRTFSEDYASGFVDGYEDYLYAGGNGEPPALPPRQYWRPKYESPDGRQAVQDWFAGFRHGVAEARMSGYRELVKVPASSPPMDTAQRFNPIVSGPPRDFTPNVPLSAGQPGVILAPAAPVEPGILPAPNPLPPPAAPAPQAAATTGLRPAPDGK
jgi:hypothetical protein